MESNEKPNPIVLTSTNESNISNNDNGIPVTIGATFALGMIGTLSVLTMLWVLRKVLINNVQHHKHTKHTQHQLKADELSRDICQRSENVRFDTIMRQSSKSSINSYSDERTLTTSTTSITTKINSNEKILTFDTVGNTLWNKDSTMTLQKQDSGLMWFLQHNSIDDEHLVPPHSVMDGNDSFTNRLYENCVRLQQSIFSSTTLLTSPTTTTTTTVTQQQQEQRVQEYRRACRPRHMHFKNIVPSDIELGITRTKHSKDKIKSSRNNNNNNCNCNQKNVIVMNDELLYPSQRDTGIISRYFGTRIQNENETNSICPSIVSISSQSSSSSLYSNDDDDTNSNTSNLYYNHNDDDLYQHFQQMGELIDL
jgi:hypothetical protein